MNEYYMYFRLKKVAIFSPIFFQEERRLKKSHFVITPYVETCAIMYVSHMENHKHFLLFGYIISLHGRKLKDTVLLENSQIPSIQKSK